jgi:hypothetical protein
MVQLSATAQREGEVERISATVTDPLPRKGSAVCGEGVVVALDVGEDGGHLVDGVDAALGRRAVGGAPLGAHLDLHAAAVTAVDARSVGSVMTTTSGWSTFSRRMYCQHRPSQSSSMTVPVTHRVTPSSRPSSFAMRAPYTAAAKPPS